MHHLSTVIACRPKKGTHRADLEENLPAGFILRKEEEGNSFLKAHANSHFITASSFLPSIARCIRLNVDIFDGNKNSAIMLIFKGGKFKRISPI